MKVLSEFHATLGNLIHHYGGTLERFAGDGLLTLFNDPLPCPDHSERAVRLAIDMRAGLQGLSQAWRQRGHELGFGIGIARGIATLGKIGFDRRFDYAAIGSVTNLASRLCDEAKSGQILIDRNVFAAAENLFEVERLTLLSLKGFSRPIEAYAILGTRQ
jgi:class 3 adenylate cyclase